MRDVLFSFSSSTLSSSSLSFGLSRHISSSCHNFPYSSPFSLALYLSSSPPLITLPPSLLLPLFIKSSPFPTYITIPPLHKISNLNPIPIQHLQHPRQLHLNTMMITNWIRFWNETAVDVGGFAHVVEGYGDAGAGVVGPSRCGCHCLGRVMGEGMRRDGSVRVREEDGEEDEEERIEKRRE